MRIKSLTNMYPCFFYSGPGTVLGAGNIEMKKTTLLCH